MEYMKKIKILMLGWEYPPYVVGGLGTHCEYLTKALSKLPVKIYFITPHPIHKKIGNIEVVGLDISQKFKEKGKIVVYGKLRKKKIKAYTEKILDIIGKYDFDVIHCQDEHPIAASIILKNVSKKPLILTIHSTVFDKSEKPGLNRFNIEKNGMVNADKVIAVSHYTKNIMVKKYKINPKKIIVIPNAVKQKRSPPKKKQGKKKYILCLGRVTYQKGIPYLIKAATKVVKKEKDVRFLIAGDGNSKYKNKLIDQIKELKLEDYFIFKGFVKDKVYYYRKADVFVMPSVSEPFGITPLEAISNGTPAIISKQSGVAELLKNCLKVDYWNTDELAKKILFLLRDKKAYNKLRNDGLKEVKNFTWEGIAKETFNLYKKMI
jgi:glycosyltransferase involved in cell wall biosynthesis